MKKILMAAVAALSFVACGSKTSTTNNQDSDTMTNDSTNVTVNLETSAGNISVLLYGDTPAHRDNFVKLVNEGYYDGTLFHRVIKDFMIQAGDPDSREAPKGKMLGMGGPDYTLPAEIVYPAHFHKRGALAAARQGDQVNPERRSSGSQFYIVTGQVYNDSTLYQLEKSLRVGRINEIFQRLRAENRDQIMAMSRAKDTEGLNALRDQMVAAAEAEADRAPGLTAEQREAYTTVGGTPHLDGQYTVFGEVIDGMDVVDAIQQAATDRQDRPEDDIRIIKATVVK
ncbi:MAG: peptidylprolyl isomerase [Muribaculaceae bacterium]|nr:peptidylprolyl isomerase [Muribaculaceae bacterium]